MTQHSGLTFFDEEALLDRLSDGVTESQKQVVFVVGAPLTSFHAAEKRGVADVSAVVDIIRQEFSSKPPQLKKFENALSKAENKYQAAFDFLVGRRGQDRANSVIKRAVGQALKARDVNSP